MNPSSPSALKAAFATTWKSLFDSPVHLDSALSKLKPQDKPLIAPVLSEILRKPVAMARACGIAVPAGEPWSLSPEQLAGWPVATRIFEILQRAPTDDAPGGVEDFPTEMVEEWRKDWGEDCAQELARSLTQEPGVVLRVQGDRDAEKVLRSLDHQGAQGGSVDPFLRGVIRFPGYAQVLGTEAYKDGWYEIQDAGSQLMARFLIDGPGASKLLWDSPGHAQPREKYRAPEKKPGALTLVDACAGAGGKTLALASLLGGKGRVYAYDVSLKKIQALRRRATRAKLTSVQAVQVPKVGADVQLKKFKGRANAVLVDAPCSGWGVLRRNPDIKWARQFQTSQEGRPLPELQGQLLSAYAPLVARGGSLVFGLCTFRKSETLDVVRKWSAEHPEFEVREGGFTGPGWSDGFFMQRWERVSR